MLMNVLEYSAKYHDRIMTNRKTSLIEISCSDNDIMSIENSWVSVMNKLKSLFGTTSSMKNYMLKLYQNDWKNLILSFGDEFDNKLKNYSRYKDEFKIENYITH